MQIKSSLFLKEYNLPSENDNSLKKERKKEKSSNIYIYIYRERERETQLASFFVWYNTSIKKNDFDKSSELDYRIKTIMKSKTRAVRKILKSFPLSLVFSCHLLIIVNSRSTNEG